MYRTRFFLLVLQISLLYGAVNGQKLAGVLQNEVGVEPGYILFAPLNSKHTYLIDECGRVINKWTSNFFPGNTAYLLPNGNLVRTKRLTNDIIDGGGGGGGVEIFDWNSTLIWTFELNTSINRLHHDIAPLPNGNILMNVWDLKTDVEAIEAGRNPTLISADKVVWAEKIIEVKPIPPSSYEIIWQWSLWDHLIQDFDAAKQNYGIVEDHPELVDVNFAPQGVISNWIHMNSIDFNAQLNQIVVSSPFLNEIWVIDHSTTTSQATSHTGGQSGKGGDLLYRWGNPQAYRAGVPTDRKLFGQHDVKWIAGDYPYGGGFILFNNNKGTDYSSVEIVTPPLDGVNYTKSSPAFGPSNSIYSFEASPKSSFYSRIMGGIEMMSNGNLLICSSLQGVIFEVTMEGDTVWRYKSPVTANGIVGRDYFPTNTNFASDNNFRAKKYPPTFSGFTGKNLTPQEPIEGEPWLCLITSTDEKEESILIYPNPIHDRFYIQSKGTQKLFVSVLNAWGSTMETFQISGSREIDASDWPVGFYIVNINGTRYRLLKVK